MNSLLKDIDTLKKQLDKLRVNLDNYRIKEALDLEFLYESNRIEGNMLTLRETSMIVCEGLSGKDKKMRELLEAIYHKFALDYIFEIATQNKSFTEFKLKRIHKHLIFSFDRTKAGFYRDEPVITLENQPTPADSNLISSLMKDYFKFYKANLNKLHPVILAAEMQERLLSIQPFFYCNGRTSRLVMNLILLQHGFPLAIIGGDADSRMAYYNALERVKTHNNKSEFIRLIANYVKSSLERYIKILGG